jgi:hypothetical protein
MTWIKALNGNVLDLPADLAAILVAQGHEEIEDTKEPEKAPATRRSTK